MHECDRHAALADGSGDPLDRPRADVTAGKDAGNARLEQVWIALKLPGVGGPDSGPVST